MRSTKLHVASDLDGDRHLIVLAGELDCSGLSVVAPEGGGNRYPFVLTTLVWDLLKMSPSWLGTGEDVVCWVAYWGLFADPADVDIAIVDEDGVPLVVREGMIIEA